MNKKVLYCSLAISFILLTILVGYMFYFVNHLHLGSGWIIGEDYEVKYICTDKVGYTLKLAELPREEIAIPNKIRCHEV